LDKGRVCKQPHTEIEDVLAAALGSERTRLLEKRPDQPKQ